jgi:hypothetical protein
LLRKSFLPTGLRLTNRPAGEYFLFWKIETKNLYSLLADATPALARISIRKIFGSIFQKEILPWRRALLRWLRTIVAGLKMRALVYDSKFSVFISEVVGALWRGCGIILR